MERKPDFRAIQGLEEILGVPLSARSKGRIETCLIDAFMLGSACASGVMSTAASAAENCIHVVAQQMRANALKEAETI